jgi:HK97 family phage prohead protease
MSATEIEYEDQAAGTEDVQSDVIVRTFAAEFTPSDGRTIDVRIVPYGKRIQANDGLGGLPRGLPYTEEWMPGAFSDQARAAEVGRAKKVFVNFEHQQGIAGLVGNGLMLREARDGFYGSFGLHETPDGDKALMLVKEGILTGISLEAFSKKSVRTAAGIVQRVKGHLHGIALCRNAAYSDAAVLAVRTAPPIFEEALLPTELDPELIERMRALGITLPQRYEAHPAETGTPAEAGTPEDGTRPTE